MKKFIDILRNDSIDNNKLEEDQLEEHFVNITNDLSEEEFKILLRLQTEPETIFFIRKNIPIKIDVFVKYLKDNVISYNNGIKIPEECIVSNIELYLITKLERLNMVHREDSSSEVGTITYSVQKNNGSMITTIHGSIPYSGVFEIRLSYIGEKYLYWVSK